MSSTAARRKAGPIIRARWFARRFVVQARNDIDVAIERDPSVGSRLEVALLRTGVHALWAHRLSHALWTNRATLAAQAVSQAARFSTGIEIHPAASIKPGVLINHGAGVVIEQAVVVGTNVTIGAGAKLLGDIDIGAWSRIGPGVVLDKSVDWGTVVAATPPSATSG